MDLVLAFVAGYLVMELVGRLTHPRVEKRKRREEERPPLFPRTGAWTPAKVVGVYGEVQTADGEVIRTGPPEAVAVDCEVVTYHLPFTAERDATLVANVLHLGVGWTVKPIDPPMTVKKGTHVTVVQPVSVVLTDGAEVGR